MGFMLGANNLGPRHRTADHRAGPHGRGGWRDAFWLVAIVGAVIGTVVWLVLPAPLDTEISEDPEAALQPLASEHSRAAVFKSASVWKFAILFCLANMSAYGLMTWVPSYLLNDKGLSLIDTGIFAAIPPFIVTALATIVGGRLVDKYFHDRARILLVPCMATSAVLLFLMTTADTVAMFTFYETLALASAVCVRCRSSRCRCGHFRPNSSVPEWV